MSFLRKSESYGISSSWMLGLEVRKRKLVKRQTTKLTLNSEMFLVEFFFLTVPSMLGYCKSLLCPYPWVEACVNKHFLQNLAVLMLSVSLAFCAVKATGFCCCGRSHRGISCYKKNVVIWNVNSLETKWKDCALHILFAVWQLGRIFFVIAAF